jgi:ElaB/YqjD/DUF883 family membrane-anchored ribosome-binding protein
MSENTPTMKTTAENITQDTAPRGLEAGVERLAKSAHLGINAATEAAGPAIERIASGAHKVVDNADAIARQAAEGLEGVGDKGQKLATSGTGLMREHPLLTLGLAVAAGYLLSYLTARKPPSAKE